MPVDDEQPTAGSNLAPMTYRPLGRTNLTVSSLGLGCASYWGKTIFDERLATQIVLEAVEQGVTFFDTGSSYSGGNAEPRLGRILRTLPKRDHLVISTKAGTRLGRFGRFYKDFSPAWIRASVEQSLRNLGCEYIPLLHLHGPKITDLTPATLDILETLRHERKVAHVSVNSFDMDVVEHVMTLPTFAAVMIDYNILRPQRMGIVTRLAERGIGVLAGMALASGVCTRGRFRIHDLQDIWYILRLAKNHRRDVIASRAYHWLHGMPPEVSAQIALAWVLGNPQVSCAVFGTTRLAHLRGNLRSVGYEISKDLLHRLPTIDGQNC